MKLHFFIASAIALCLPLASCSQKAEASEESVKEEESEATTGATTSSWEEEDNSEEAEWTDTEESEWQTPGKTVTQTPEKPAAGDVVITLASGATLPAPAGKPIVADLFTTWCGPCKYYSPIFHEVASEYASKAVFYRVDIEECPAVANKFGVNAIPTTVIILPGGKYESVTGAMDKAELIQFLNKYIK